MLIFIQNYIAIIDILEFAIAINWGVSCNFLILIRNSDLLQYERLHLNYIAIIDIWEFAIEINWGVSCNFLQLIRNIDLLQ